MFFLAPLVSAIVPFIIWPIELLLPYPYVIEEVAKAFLVASILKAPTRSTRIALTFASAALFTFSETVLYSLNISLVGTLSTMLVRLMLTYILHSITMLILLYFLEKRVWWQTITGIVIAVLIHFLFNVVIRGLG